MVGEMAVQTCDEARGVGTTTDRRGARSRPAGSVQDAATVNLGAARGVAMREFPLKKGHGFADYLLYVDRQAAGVVEAKKEGDDPHRGRGAGRRSTATASRTSSRPTCALCRSSTRAPASRRASPTARPRAPKPHWSSTSTGRRRLPSGRLPLRQAPDRAGRSGRQIRLRRTPSPRPSEHGSSHAAAGRGRTVAGADPRPSATWRARCAMTGRASLIQMATGSGKTFTAITAIYRLIKFARRAARAVPGGPGQPRPADAQGVPAVRHPRQRPEVHRAVQRPAPASRTRSTRSPGSCITTIQRLYSMLRGEAEFDPSVEEGSQFEHDRPACPGAGRRSSYNPAIPIETFDVIFTDECHRSIYNLWRQVLEYFDAYLVGLTATPSKQTFGFFNQNLVMEYGHEQAVADGVNVDFDVYRIRTQITQGGLDRSRPGCSWTSATARRARVRWEQLDDDLTYDAEPARPRRGGDGPDPHGRPDVPRQAVHRDLPRPHGGAQDADLRQGRQPRRRHRPDRPRGVRQGQRLRQKITYRPARRGGDEAPSRTAARSRK